MLLKTLYVRFYKSFNYDYLKKSSQDPSPNRIWEYVDEEQKLESWYPYVEIPIDSKVTTIVGANESGKSHLLDAIQKGITGEGIKYEDFCRYSDFFTVTKGEFKFPDFGFEWELELSKKEDKDRLDKLKAILGIQSEVKSNKFLMFRTNLTNITLCIDDDRYTIDDKQKEAFSQLLPKILLIQSKISLPNSVPIQAIIDIDKGTESKSDSYLNLGLDKWQSINKLLEKMVNEKEIPCNDTHEYDGFKTNSSGEVYPTKNYEKTYYNITTDYNIELTTRNDLRNKLRDSKRDELQDEQFLLAHKLICKVANIDSDFLLEIIKHSFNDKKQGYVSAIIDRINKNLSERLNFPSWWVQDKEFKLVVSVSNYHLKFAIKDKTGTTYSFAERSQGLQYFLSYYIQYKSHQPISNQQEILLMDEPDAYLSSQAQQDMMKIFKAFAEGKDKRDPVQVIFVTHSPFLIDKNHPSRIRVLEKGTEEQGTRVVKDIARNHYEPLRSSVGSLVGETAFIGNCNLIVSSLSEQVIISGLATYLNQLKDTSESDTLDLNHITIVPAGDTLQIPFLIRLLRQDTEKPAMIVFLSSDSAGDKIQQKILEEDQVKFSSLKKDFVIQINQLIKSEESKGFSGLINKNLIELEDLIPLSLAIEAVRLYQEKMLFSLGQEALTIQNIKSHWAEEKSLFINLQDYLATFKIELERLGFAKCLIDVVKNDINEHLEAKKQLEHNFKILFGTLNDLKGKSELDFSQEKISEKVARFIKNFRMANLNNASRTEIEQLFKTIENVLDSTEASSQTTSAIRFLQQHYKTATDPLSQIEGSEYTEFCTKLEEVKFTPQLRTQEPDQESQITQVVDDTTITHDKEQVEPNPSSQTETSQGQKENQSKGKGFSETQIRTKRTPPK